MRWFGPGLVVVGLCLLVSQLYAYHVYGHWPRFDVRMLLANLGVQPAAIAHHDLWGLTQYLLSLDVGASTATIGIILALVGRVPGQNQSMATAGLRSSLGAIVAIVALIVFGLSVFGAAAGLKNRPLSFDLSEGPPAGADASGVDAQLPHLG